MYFVLALLGTETRSTWQALISRGIPNGSRNMAAVLRSTQKEFSRLNGTGELERAVRFVCARSAFWRRQVAEQVKTPFDRTGSGKRYFLLFVTTVPKLDNARSAVPLQLNANHNA